MKHYAYRIYKNTPGNAVIGGTISGEDMEHAAQRVIKSNGVEVIHEPHNGQEYHYFMLNGSKVGILVYINPEDF